MNLITLRTEVLNTGFDPVVFSGRINQYLNDAQNRVARAVDYYVNETSQPISTVAGTASYPLPANFARVRSLYDTNRNAELQYVGLRDIDRSTPSTGVPGYFALDGANLHLYPTPDTIYPLSLRYWMLPAALAADTDTPNIPADYHYILVSYALWKCYEREDDPQMAGYHQQQFQQELAQLSTDLKFPTSQEPSQVRGMWDRGPSLGRPGWTAYGGW